MKLKEEPRISKQELKKVIEENYNFKVKDFKFIHKGADADSYRILTEENKRFLIKIYDLIKIKKLYLEINFEGLRALSSMHKKHEIDKISYPIFTKNGELYTSYKQYRLILYNFIEGKNDDKHLSKPQLKNFAGLLARIHKLPDEIKKSIKWQEKFTDRHIIAINPLIEKLNNKKNPSRYLKKTLDLINQNLAQINKFSEDTSELAKRLANKGQDYVVCHTDPHFLNLIKNKEQVYIIDWDGIRLSPKEHDLWFYLVRSLCKTPVLFLKYYERVYGKFKLDKQLIHFYVQLMTIRDLIYYLAEIERGRENPIYLKEIKNYSLKWIFNMEKMLRDIDKIVDEWNKK